MAAQGVNPQQGAILQIVKVIQTASEQLARLFPPASPMADEIMNQLSMAQNKIAETQSPQMPQAPPI